VGGSEVRPCHGHRPVISSSSEKLRKVRLTTINARTATQAQAYMTRRAAENKSKRAARRAHKRQLANVIIRRMWDDADNLARANSTPSSAAA